MVGIEDIASRTAARHQMFAPSAPVVAMVSGGADSVAMLLMIAEGVFGPLRPLVVHVNHGLRGAESDGDEAFVREIAASLGIEVRVASYDVAAFAEANKLNLEDAGRRVRYRFAESELDAHCARLGEPVERGRIAVAHTLDDRIETFFVRALFGAGAGGLASIAPVRDRIVRPLLSVERAPLREWLIGRGQAWREDASNADTSRLRAHVRATMLPAAEKVNPAFRAALERTMDLLVADDALLSSMAEAFARDFAESEPGREVRFERALIATLDPTMARRTIRSAIIGTFPEASRIEASHIEAVLGGFDQDAFACDLPGGLRAFTEYGKMVISRESTGDASMAPVLLPVGGKADMGEAGVMAAERVSVDSVSFPIDSAESIVIDADRLSGELIVDSAKAGDRMRPLGMSGSRKLSDLLVDAKVPRRVRGRVPVVRDGECIVWLAGIRMSEEYRVTGSTVDVIRLTWTKPTDAPAHEDRSS